MDEEKDRPVFDDLGKNVPPFEEYFDSHIEYIKTVQAEMAQPLDDMPAIMDRQARTAESHQARMRTILAFSDSYLDVAEHLNLVKIGPRATDFTDTDRSIALAASVARERRFRDVIRGLCDSLEVRVSYSQTRLRVFSQAEGQKFQT